MRRLIILSIGVLAIAAIAGISATPASARPRGTNGKIVTNSDNLITGHEEVYTVDPDGTDETLISSDTEAGQWSPDGSMFVLFGPAGETLLDPDTGIGISYGLPDNRYPGLHLFCGTWSPDGNRLACEGFGDDPSLNGVYTLRALDGGDLRRVTWEPNGDDCPSDYSPNGNRLIVTRATDTSYGLYTVRTDGTDLRPLVTNMEFNFCDGNWSPQANEIAFSAHVPNGDYHSSVWVVHANGTGLRQIPIAGPCGGPFADPTTYGCFRPIWSPDGTKIAFGRNIDDDQRDIYTVNADGSGLFRVTHTPNISEFNGDWGTHPLTP